MKKFYLYSLFIIAVLIMIFTIAISLTPRMLAQTMQQARLGTNVLIRGAEQGKPWINLRDGREMLTSFEGNEADQLMAGGAQPLTLAFADFDEDGIPDLVSGYTLPHAITLHRGNVNAIYPHTPEVRQRKATSEFSEAPFLSPAQMFAVPEAPVFIGTGDFNADRHQDVVMTAAGSHTMYWLAGDGKGGFAAPQDVALSGNVTALVTGEINRANGLADVIVSIVGEAGAQLLIFEGAKGALKVEPEVMPLPAPATALALGQLDDEYTFDLAVAAGNELLIVHGRDRKMTLSESLRSDVKPAVIERIPCNFEIASLAIGRFTNERNDAIAMLATNGVVHLVQRDTAKNTSLWGNEVGEVSVMMSSTMALNSSPSPRLVRASLSSRPYDDLVVVDAGNRQLHIVMGEMLLPPSARAKNDLSVLIPQQPITLNVEGTPAAVLPMRLNVDALSDLVLLKSGGQSALSIMLTEAVSTFTVNTELGNADNKPGDGICADFDGKCSFEAALQENDAGAGGATINFSVPTASAKFIYETHWIRKPVTIDGTSQGHVTLTYGISGSLLEFAGGKTVVRGLSFGNGTLRFRDNADNLIENNYGRTLVVWSDRTTVGGTFEGARNYMAVFGNNGVRDNLFKGNTVGFIAPNTPQVIGSRIGIFGNSTNTIIGGTEQGAGNLIYGEILLQGAEGNPPYIVSGTQIIFNGIYSINCAEKTSSTWISNNAIEFSETHGLSIHLDSKNNVIRENSIKSHAQGGILLEGTDNQILGNLIAGNGLGGVFAGIKTGQGAARNVILANWIGLYNTGNLADANNGPGLEINASDNTIGGDRNTEGNLISANKGPGILINAGAKNNQVKGNWIGVQSNGTSPLGNTGDGITNNGESNSIGAASTNLRNLIAFNGGNGVTINAGDKSNSLLGNEIYSNQGKGISIKSGQVIPLPDLVLNFRNGRTVIDGKLSGTASTTYRIEFFTNEECDSSGSGEGKAFLGAQNVTTDANGRVQFSPELYPAQNQIVTATVTDPANNTSEFSKCSELDDVKIVTIVPAITEVLTAGATQDFTVTASYSLKSRFQAEVGFELKDAAQNVVAFTSEPIKSTDGPGQKELKLTGVKIPAGSDRLIVKVFLYDISGPGPGPIFKEAPLIEYKITSQDSIEIQNATFDGVPAATAKIYTGSTVEYKCDIRYHIPSDPKGGVVALQAFDMTSGAAKAISEIVLVPVDKTTEPKLLIGEKITVNIPSDATRIQVRAVLLDSSGVTIVTKQFVDYTPIQIKIEIGDYDAATKTFTPFNPPLVLIGGEAASKQRKTTIAFKVTTSLGAEFNQAVPTFPLYKQKSGAVTGYGRATYYTAVEPLPNPVYTVGLDEYFSTVPNDADQLLFQVKYIFTATNKVVASSFAPVQVERVKIITKSGTPNFPSSATTLTPGRTEKYGFWLEYNMNRPGVNKLLATIVCDTPAGLQTQIIEPALKPSGERFEFDVTIPGDARNMILFFVLANQTDPVKVHSDSVYCKNMDKTKITIPAGVGQVISNTLGVNLNIIQNTIDRAVDTIRTVGNLSAVSANKPKSFSLAQPTSIAEQDVTLSSLFSSHMLINSYWNFNPAIPGDGTFLADLTLQYSPTDLPDNPNFNPANLKVIAYDPTTGSVEVYPSTVNLSARTVTARVNRLAPYYTLGVGKSVTGKSLNFPVLRQTTDFASQLLLLNTGSANVSLAMRAYAPDGELYSGQGIVNPVTVMLPASQLTSSSANAIFNMTSSTNGGWMQVTTNQQEVRGYELIGKGNKLDGLDIQRDYPTAFVLTSIEANDTWTTEIHLANITNFISDVTLELKDAAGNTLGTWEKVFPARTEISGDLRDLFPDLAGNFTGYLVGHSDQSSAAAALLTSAKEMAALQAQPLRQSENISVKLYAPYVAAQSSLSTRVNIVNPTTNAAALKLQWINSVGASLASPINITLNAGQQYQRAIEQLFSIAPGSISVGQLIIESNMTGIVGDVSYFDPSGQMAFRASLPLKAETGSSFLFPYLDNRTGSFTQLMISNVWVLPANVDLQVFSADGSMQGAARLTLPSSYSLIGKLQELMPFTAGLSGGYFRVQSDQPIIADALFGTALGTMLAALPAQREDGTISAKVASVSAATYLGNELASESIISAYGPYLATATGALPSLPLPTSLGGTTVQFQDSTGTIRLAPLFYVSPSQINFQIPAGTSTGLAQVTVTNGNGFVATGNTSIVKVRPGIFTATQNGSGLAAANALYINPDGSRDYSPIWRYDPVQEKIVAIPIDVSRANVLVFLEVYGTGLRFNSGLPGVQCLLGGTPADVSYAGPQGTYVGLDQINILIPKTLTGRGEVDLELMVDKQKANMVKVNIK